ncbi:MAG: hypothetical protein NTX50_24910, partial [Candidatus Sumerlaeota bacterium]|nr:hypothetical protein [Candidatus Sumerlaeota bacterium]
MLVLAGAYTPAALYIIFAIEILWALAMDIRDRGAFVQSCCSLDACNWKRLALAVSPHHSTQWKANLAAFLIFCQVLGVYLIQASSVPGSVFAAYDTLVSYNPWAVSWAQGQVPTHTYHYPQLMPSVWSVSYVFIHNVGITFFAKILMIFFPFALLFGMADLAVRANRPLWLLGPAVAGMTFVYFLGWLFFDGMADMPVAFMGFMPFYWLLSAKPGAGNARLFKYLLAGSVLAAAGALTKQAGIWTAAVFPIFAFWEVRSAADAQIRRSAWIRPLICALFIAAVVAPWYIYAHKMVLLHPSSNEVPFLLGAIHHGRGIAGRLLAAMKSFGPDLPPRFPVFLIFMLALTGLRASYWQKHVALILVPYFFIWALGFSYDGRNFALAIPVLCAAAAE